MSEENHIGKRRGLLEVIKFFPREGKRWTGSYTVKCDCGVILHMDIVTFNRMITCGHSRDGTVEGQREMKEYRIWKNMRTRCRNPNTPGWKNYGGRGITFCERWNSFANFLADMGRCPEGGSIERIDNEKGYSPENCKWATRIEQCRNRRGIELFTHEGETLTVTEWGRKFGVSPETIRTRMATGLSLIEAIRLIDTTSGVKGIQSKKRKTGQGWEIWIPINGKRTYFGYFPEIEKAKVKLSQIVQQLGLQEWYNSPRCR